MSYRVGIDLGTTNSALAFTELGKQRCVKLDKNTFTSAVFPSCIALDKGQPRYGGDARRMPAVVREFKRGIGRGASYQLGDKLHSSLELSAMLLAEMKQRFEVAHGSIEGAVITVPANFDDRKRNETKEAGRLAGLNVLRVINEPSAAAIAYSLSNRPPAENAVVVDWGGGTLDVSVVDCVAQVLDIKANDGEEYCGGLDIDRAILRLLEHKCRAQVGDRFNDPIVQGELLLACEKIKIHLSDEHVWDEPIDSRMLRTFIDFQLTRRELDQAILPQIEVVVGCVKRCLTRVPEGALSPADVTDVILVGGSCFIPLLRTRIEQLFGKAPRMDLNPMEVVALGAAYQAEHAVKTGALVTLHSLARPLGVSCVGFDRRGVRRQNSFAPIIEAGTKIPARATHIFETINDGQDSIRVAVYEPSESVDVVDNLEPWDTKVIDGLPNKPAGSFPIKITFDYSIDQCLTVTVEVESEGIKTSWTPQHVRRLQQSRAESAEAVENFRGLGIAPLREFRTRLKVALERHPSNDKIDALLDQFDALLENGDVASATKVKQELGVALFEAGIHL